MHVGLRCSKPQTHEHSVLTVEPENNITPTVKPRYTAPRNTANLSYRLENANTQIICIYARNSAS